MVAPVALAGRDVVVERADLALLRGRERVTVRDQEVAVAVQVRVAEREGPLQVRPHEPVSKDLPRPTDDLVEQPVELGIRRHGGHAARR